MKASDLTIAIAGLRRIAKRDRLGFRALARLIREVEKTARDRAVRS